MKIASIAASTLTALSIFGCGAASQKSSDVNFLVFERVYGPITKVNTQETLRICVFPNAGEPVANGETLNRMLTNSQNAMNFWVDALKRHSPAVRATAASFSANSEGECRGEDVKIRYTWNDIRESANTTIVSTINIDTNTSYNVYVHEFGHVFNLADIYMEDPRTTGYPGEGGCLAGHGNSIMCGNNVENPQDAFNGLFMNYDLINNRIRPFLIQHSGGSCVHPQYGGGNTYRGNPLVLWPTCNTQTEVTFHQLPNGAIQHVKSGFCIHPRGGANVPANDTELLLDPGCDVGERIAFDLLPNGLWQHRLSKKCIHPQGGSGNPAPDTKLLLIDQCSDEGRLKYSFQHRDGSSFINYQ